MTPVLKNLFHTINVLQDMNPAYVSVTDGVVGSTREKTHQLITSIQEKTPLTVVSHLT